jgi:TPR repeat protein
MESMKMDEELDSISRFNAMKQRALSPNNISNGPIQVEWTTLLLAVASDKGFVSKYTLNSEPMKSDASPSEIKKNEHSFIKAAIKTLKRTCSDVKDSEAQFILGSLYSNSPTIKVPKPDLLERNYEKAFDYYAKAGAQGHALALYRLGVSFELGIGASMNEQRALDAFTRSAQAGSVPSMFKLGLIYSRGVLGARRSAAKSMEWLIKASHNADLENPHALFELSKIMERDLPFIASPSVSDMEYLSELDRLGYTKDEVAGLNYCKAAAKLGYSPAQCKLGWCYEYGKLRCVIDAKKSIGWYSRAAKQGNPQAEMALSGWYLTGAKNILEPNDREAFLWALKSTEGGFVKAEYALGYYYEVGLGCEKDLEMAKRFYQRAATQGHEKAIEKLRAMRLR